MSLFSIHLKLLYFFRFIWSTLFNQLSRWHQRRSDNLNFPQRKQSSPSLELTDIIQPNKDRAPVFIPTPTLFNVTSTLPHSDPSTQTQHSRLSPYQVWLAGNSSDEALILAAILFYLLIALLALQFKLRSRRIYKPQLVSVARRQTRLAMSIVSAPAKGNDGKLMVEKSKQQEEKREENIGSGVAGEDESLEEGLLDLSETQADAKKDFEEGVQGRLDLQAADIDKISSDERLVQLCVEDDGVQHGPIRHEEAESQNNSAEQHTTPLHADEDSPLRKGDDSDEDSRNQPAAQCELEVHEPNVQDITPIQATSTTTNQEDLPKSIADEQMDDAQIQEHAHAIADLIHSQVRRLTQAAAKLHIGATPPDLERGQTLKRLGGIEEAQSKDLAKKSEIQASVPTKRHDKLAQAEDRYISATSSPARPLGRIDLNIMPTAPVLLTKGTLKEVAA